MKPVTAFAAGLWTGAVVAGLVGLWYVKSGPWSRRDAGVQLRAELQAKEDENRSLRREQARLNAEVQRWQQAVAELKRERPVTPVALIPPEPPPEEPLLVPQPPVTPSGPPKWIEEAVAKGDVAALSRLEALALQNDGYALEALAQMADLDAAAALTEVWVSGKLDDTNRLRAARWLGATADFNPVIEDILRSLLADPNPEPSLMNAALTGLMAPPPADVPGRRPRGEPGGALKPDYELRAALLDRLLPVITNERVRAEVQRLQEALAALAGEPAELPAQ